MKMNSEKWPQNKKISAIYIADDGSLYSGFFTFFVAEEVEIEFEFSSDELDLMAEDDNVTVTVIQDEQRGEKAFHFPLNLRVRETGAHIVEVQSYFAMNAPRAEAMHRH